MKRALKRLLYKYQSVRLPLGMTEFNVWADDILDTYEMPNNDSTKFALATAIMHAKNGQGSFPKAFFGEVLVKGAANQVAHAIMIECKERQEARAKEEKEQAERQAQVDADVKALEAQING